MLLTAVLFYFLVISETLPRTTVDRRTWHTASCHRTEEALAQASCFCCTATSIVSRVLILAEQPATLLVPDAGTVSIGSVGPRRLKFKCLCLVSGQI